MSARYPSTSLPPVTIQRPSSALQRGGRLGMLPGRANRLANRQPKLASLADYFEKSGASNLITEMVETLMLARPANPVPFFADYCARASTKAAAAPTVAYEEVCNRDGAEMS